MPIGTGVAILGAGAIAGGSSILGAGKASSAAKQAAAEQLQMYNTTAGNLAPFRQAGQGVLPQLTAAATSGPTGGYPNYLAQAQGALPGQMTQAQLNQTPGYQWQLAQGLKATQSAAASRGLGVSGSSLKGAATYATGLADSNYQNQFNNAQQRFTDYVNLNQGAQANTMNSFNRLQNTASLGENAAAQTGTIGQQAAGTAGNFLNQAGLAQAAGVTGVGSAATGAAQNLISNNLLSSYLASQGGPTNQGQPNQPNQPVSGQLPGDMFASSPASSFQGGYG